MGAAGTILVTGATGYIGGRLVPRLLEEGRSVRVLVRDRERVRSRPWAGQVEVAVGDVLDRGSLSEALAGVDTAYYLVHSMCSGSGAGFHELDVQAARTFGQAAAEAGAGHIIYLGGLGSGEGLSPHLRSRQECGRALRAGGVAVTEFRAAVVVGAGSISFEMIRYLVERLPVMVCPRWLYSRVQPIAVDDLLDYLVAALDTPSCRGRIVEVGGKDVTTYEGLMLGYARARGLHRLMLAVPVPGWPPAAVGQADIALRRRCGRQHPFGATTTPGAQLDWGRIKAAPSLSGSSHPLLRRGGQILAVDLGQDSAQSYLRLRLNATMRRIPPSTTSTPITIASIIHQGDSTPP